jgi:transposase InsO family protein
MLTEGKNIEKYSIVELCRIFDVTRQGYEKYVKSLYKLDKHAPLLAEIEAIIEEDEFNDKYGRARIVSALKLRGIKVSESTVYRVCSKFGLLERKKKPYGLTKADKEATREADLLKGDFVAEEPNKKLIGDITQLPTAEGTLYIAGVYDCFDNKCLGLVMDDNMRDELTQNALIQASRTHPLAGATFHSDFGSQYTSKEFKELAYKEKITQSMSLARLSCYGNAKCESIFGRFKVEAIYKRYDTKSMSMDTVKMLIFRYFMGYWNNRRISTANGGLPPSIKRQLYYDNLYNTKVA